MGRGGKKEKSFTGCCLKLLTQSWQGNPKGPDKEKAGVELRENRGALWTILHPQGLAEGRVPSHLS